MQPPDIQTSQRIQDGSHIIELLIIAEKMVRGELQRQRSNGNGRFEVTCLLEAQLNIAKAIETLYDGGQSP